jgi:hypothetical protein
MLLRKYISKRAKNIEYFRNVPFYLVVDELQDQNSRKILNVLIGECSEREHFKPKISKTVELENAF